jgi:hypothetical protein
LNQSTKGSQLLSFLGPFHIWSTRSSINIYYTVNIRPRRGIFVLVGMFDSCRKWSASVISACWWCYFLFDWYYLSHKIIEITKNISSGICTHSNFIPWWLIMHYFLVYTMMIDYALFSCSLKLIDGGSLANNKIIKSKHTVIYYNMYVKVYIGRYH